MKEQRYNKDTTKMNIDIISRKNFDLKMITDGITDQTIEDYSSKAFICILSTPAISIFNTEPYFKLPHPNVLSLTFDDLTDKDLSVLKEYPGSRLMDLEDAKKIVDFVARNKERDFVIHCSAGISRSGAIGTYIQQNYGTDYDLLIQKNPAISPNYYILSLLNEVNRSRIH